MTNKNHKNRSGMTLIELMITVLAVVILIVGISGILAAGHENYNVMLKRVNSEVVRNAYEARRTFDRIARKASIKLCEFDDSRNGSYDRMWLYYFSDANNLTIVDPDKYAMFYLGNVDGEPDTELILEHGDVQPGTFDSSDGPTLLNPTSYVLAHNVVVDPAEPGAFLRDGVSIQMILTLDNEEKDNSGNNIQDIETMKMTVSSTVIMHNGW